MQRYLKSIESVVSMKLKVSSIKPNPFKKQIGGGKLNPDTVLKIRSNLKELGLMGSIPIFKKGKSYYAVSHHHRIEAVKQELGKDFEVEAVVHDYNEEQVLRGMAVENLTQRNSDDIKEVVENLVMIRKFLKNNVAGRSPTNQNPRKQNQPEAGSTSHIAEWLLILEK